MSAEIPQRSDELMSALASADVLADFLLLPSDQQTNFHRWVIRSVDAESRYRRVDALVLAMRSGLLAVRHAPPEALEA